MKTTFVALATLALGAVSAAAQEAPVLGALPPLTVEGPKAQAMVDLGRLLFFDPRLSGDSSTSCADCHDPRYGFGDAAELSRGYPGTRHWRNSQTIVNSAYLTGGLHWDGTVTSLTHQVPGALKSAFVANVDPTMVEERLRQVPDYGRRFSEIWAAPPDLEKTAEAIAAYERTLISTDSAFDQFARGEGNLSTEAGRGLHLFLGKANCISCHSGTLATDQAFHNTSVPPNPSFAEDPLLQVTFRVTMREFGLDPQIYETFDRDPGRYIATGDPADLGRLRTPPLRYLTHTAPYMHNGVFYTLEEVVDFYNSGGTPDVFGTKSPLIRPLGLTAAEKADLVAFLESMSGSEIAEDYPDLPPYEVRQFPLLDRETQPVAASVQAPTPQDSTPAGGGATIESTSPGLAIVPAGS